MVHRGCSTSICGSELRPPTQMHVHSAPPHGHPDIRSRPQASVYSHCQRCQGDSPAPLASVSPPPSDNLSDHNFLVCKMGVMMATSSCFCGIKQVCAWTGLDAAPTHCELPVNAGLGPAMGTRPLAHGWNNSDGGITQVAQLCLGFSRAGSTMQQRGH